MPTAGKIANNYHKNSWIYEYTTASINMSCYVPSARRIPSFYKFPLLGVRFLGMWVRDMSLSKHLYNLCLPSYYV